MPIRSKRTCVPIIPSHVPCRQQAQIRAFRFNRRSTPSDLPGRVLTRPARFPAPPRSLCGLRTLLAEQKVVWCTGACDRRSSREGTLGAAQPEAEGPQTGHVYINFAIPRPVFASVLLTLSSSLAAPFRLLFFDGSDCQSQTVISHQPIVGPSAATHDFRSPPPEPVARSTLRRPSRSRQVFFIFTSIGRLSLPDSHSLIGTSGRLTRVQFIHPDPP